MRERKSARMRREHAMRASIVTRLSGMVVAVTLTTTAASATSVVDDGGQVVTLTSPARRIISLAPSITELLYAVGAGPAVVGTVDYSDFPSDAKKIARVGSNGLLDMERIVALRPDLIVVWRHGGYERQLTQLRTLGVPIFYSEPSTLAEIPRSLRAFGDLTGNSAPGDEAARRFTADVERIRLRYAGASPVSVFYQVWERPLLTINGKHIIDDVIRICGGRNIFAALPSLVAEVSVESVVQADPDAIVTATADPAVDDGLAQWRRVGTMRAVTGHDLIILDADQISRQGPRIVDGARDLCAKLDAVRAKSRK
jgi:iron complex transport system substrate-binding protein